MKKKSHGLWTWEKSGNERGNTGRRKEGRLPSSDAALRRWEMRTADGRTDARSGEKLVIRLLRVIDGGRLEGYSMLRAMQWYSMFPSRMMSDVFT